ncbi:MAG: GNAT family N-acetyltransferase [Pirellulales bacterium]
MLVGLWLHEPSQPRLVGFARCIGDGVREVVVCDVAITPEYQGIGLGKQLMAYVLDVLRQAQVERLTLFADPEAVKFYTAQGWELEPEGRRCAYWHEPDDAIAGEATVQIEVDPETRHNKEP